MIDAKDFANQPIKSYIKPNRNIKKITIDQGDYYTTISLMLVRKQCNKLLFLQIWIEGYNYVFHY